jgi:hypothetical protein
LSGQPESDLSDDTWLLRRAQPRALDPNDGSVKAIAFNLRPAQGESTLSLYNPAAATAETVLLAAPGDGWGVLTVRVSDLRALGCIVFAEADLNDPLNGDAHVAVSPPEYDEDGQIPALIRARMAVASTWVVVPDGGKI